ncbi:hypothetical protein DY052_06345 [Apilactobacillus timberlakei]|uniref:hypothetical protein n=1 Tax=Apilactobacillus timberlakei TaxID=2008380 RepID=UPI00112BA301|nr:hypothetical protein [Apilactobacillus timberlakei]TPR15044.1 hypothetical protein DY052_06345 [Apilactobacillus timberlakei]
MDKKHHYFLLSNDIAAENADTKSMAIKGREKFQKQGFNTFILTRNYNPSLHQNMDNYHLNDEQVINMYDYIQSTTHVNKEPNYLRFSSLFDKHKYKINGIDNNHSMIEYHGKNVAKVNFMPLTYGEMGIVSYYDNFNHITSRDFYDYRGFKSKTEYLHMDGKVGHELYYNLDGQVVLEINHMNIDGTVYPTMYQLTKFNGTRHRFRTENEMFAFIMDDICDNYKGSVVMNDCKELNEAVDLVKNTNLKFKY